MTVKTFCDGCGVEIDLRQAVGDRRAGHSFEAVKAFRNAMVKVRVEVMGSRKGVGSVAHGELDVVGDVDWCKHCLIDAVDMRDDRPRAAVSATVCELIVGTEGTRGPTSRVV